MVVLFEDEYESNPKSKGKVGTGGIHRWYFFALNRGKTTLQFELYREADKIVRKMEYIIIVM